MTRVHVPGLDKALCLGVVLLFLATATPAAAAYIVGLPADSGTGNCFPFGCNYDSVGTEYQQVYTSSLFTGPMTITGLDFYNTQLDFGATAMNTGTFTISLSTTSADWNTLSGTYANNIGGDNTQVFSGSLAQAWAFGDTLTILFSTPFTYTPGPGANLLLDVLATGTGAAGGSIYFDTNGNNGGNFNGNTFFGRVYTNGNVDAGYGLVTGFETSAVPEPSTFAMILGAGLATLAAARLRKRNA